MTTAQPDPPRTEPGDDKPQAEEAEPEKAEAPNEPEAATENADVDELKALADENWNKFLRASAEVENVRKRATRDIENTRKFALEKFSNELLAVKDSLEMGLAASDASDSVALREGCEATLKLLTSTLERFGVVCLDPEGEPFDPEQHEAMTMQPSADAEPGTVLKVFQKGYALNGRLLRPARVVVAQEPAQD